jgi:hypothetical protein
VVPQVTVSALGVWAHVLVPLQLSVMQAVLVQVIPTPAHAPPPHVSVWVHGSPSSQSPARLHCHVPPSFVQW